MKAQRALRTRRALRTNAPRTLRRRRTLATDATIEPAPGPGPEEVFDRVTGPYGARGAFGEEP